MSAKLPNRLMAVVLCCLLGFAVQGCMTYEPAAVVTEPGRPAHAGRLAVPTMTLMVAGKPKLSQPESVGLTDTVINGLMESGYVILERAVLDKILSEQKLTTSDLFDTTKATELGKLAGASTVVAGQWTTLEDGKFQQSLSIRALRVSDGVVLFSVIVQCRFNSNGYCSWQELVNSGMEALKAKLAEPGKP